MLDLAVLIALYYCELNFMCRVIPEAKKPGAKENHQRPFNEQQEAALKEDRWTETGIDKRFDYVIDKLEDLQKYQENTVDHFTTKFAETNRKGLKVIPWQ